MNLSRFEQLVGAYGADPEKWPADERRQALELVDSSPDAKTLLSEARKLDSLLDQTSPVEIDLGALESRIVSNARPFGPILDWLFPGHLTFSQALLRPAMAMALPLLAGIAIGFSTANGGLLTDDQEMQVLAISWHTSEAQEYEVDR